MKTVTNYDADLDAATAVQNEIGHNNSTQSGGLNSERTAGLMRWLGALAVAASAVVFMLQGLANIDLDMRNWVYLGLMALMAGCGVASQKLLQDAKGTRLFFGLAALLVPVQFSQLGGLLHELYTAQATVVPHIGWLLIGTAVLSLPVAYAAMAILARPNKRVLSISLLALSAALLLPFRASIAGFFVLAVIVGIALVIQLRFLNKKAPGSTWTDNWEHKGLRLLLAAPAVIAGVRMSMHIDSTAGIAAMGGLTAVVMVRLSASNTFARFCGAMLGMISWMAYAVEAIPGTTDSHWAIPILCLPMSLWLLHVARLETIHGRLYRGIASGLYGLSAASLVLFNSGDSAMQLLSLAHGGVALTWGVHKNHREPTLIGAGIIAVTLLIMIVDALGSVEVNSWIALGVAGIGLVFGASVLEKHGRKMVGRSRNAWSEVKSWD